MRDHCEQCKNKWLRNMGLWDGECLLCSFGRVFTFMKWQESYKFGGGRGSGYIVRGGVEVCHITFYCLLYLLQNTTRYVTSPFIVVKCCYPNKQCPLSFVVIWCHQHIWPLINSKNKSFKFKLKTKYRQIIKKMQPFSNFLAGPGSAQSVHLKP